MLPFDMFIKFYHKNTRRFRRDIFLTESNSPLANQRDGRRPLVLLC